MILSSDPSQAPIQLSLSRRRGTKEILKVEEKGLKINDNQNYEYITRDKEVTRSWLVVGDRGAFGGNKQY